MKFVLGDYWQAIHRPIGPAITTFMDRFDEYHVVARFEHLPADCPTEWNGVTPMLLRDLLVDSIAWVTCTESGQLLIVSHYPTVIDGGESSAIVIRSTAWPENVEGFVSVRIDETELTFFDTHFPLSRDRYEPGETATITFCAFAVTIHRLADIAEYAGTRKDLAEEISKVFERGQTFLRPSPAVPDIEDRYVFMGQIGHIKKGKIGELTVYRAQIKLLPGLEIPLVFGKTSIDTPDWEPREESFVSAIIFLHGYRTALSLLSSTSS